MICDWIYDKVKYLFGSTDSQTSAFDTATERAGVCRDFAHLGIAFFGHKIFQFVLFLLMLIILILQIFMLVLKLI